MPRFRPAVLGVPFLLLALPNALMAQKRPVELGIDFGLEVLQFEGESALELSIPGGGGFSSYQTGFRVGFPTSDKVRVEPALGFSYQSSDGNSFYNLRTVISVVADVAGRPGGTRPYVKAGAGARILGGSSESDTQFLAGGGLGVRTPIAPHLATRVEVTYARAFESDLVDALNIIDVRFGFSFMAGGDE